MTEFYLDYCQYSTVLCRLGPRNKWLRAKDHGKDLFIILYLCSQQLLVVLGWPAVVLQHWIFRCWQTPEPSGSLVEWPLSEGGKLLPPRQGHAGLLSLSSEQTGGKHSYPAAISARQRPITTRQRANSKRTWMKPDGSEWSYVAKVSVVIISDKLKL